VQYTVIDGQCGKLVTDGGHNSISTHYEDMKGDTKCRKWGDLE